MAHQSYAEPKPNLGSARQTNGQPPSWKRASASYRLQNPLYYTYEIGQGTDRDAFYDCLNFYLQQTRPDFVLLLRMALNFQPEVPDSAYLRLIDRTLGTSLLYRDQPTSVELTALILCLRLIAEHELTGYVWDETAGQSTPPEPDDQRRPLLRQWRLVFSRRTHLISDRARVAWLVDCQEQLADATSDDLLRQRWDLAARAADLAVGLATQTSNPRPNFREGALATQCQAALQAMRESWVALSPATRQTLEQQVARSMETGNPAGVKNALLWARARILAQLCGVPSRFFRDMIEVLLLVPAATETEQPAGGAQDL